MSTTTKSKKPATDSVIPTVGLTGYAKDNVLFASRYQQGGRTVYDVVLTPQQIIDTVSKPDVDAPSPGNRRIRKPHAESFGKYLRERDDWVSPSIILRTPRTFTLDIQAEVGVVQFGTISIPRRSLSDLHIIEGQHRIYGMFCAHDDIKADLAKATDNLSIVRRLDGEDSVAHMAALARLTEIQEQRTRLESDAISVQIIVESDPVAYKQMFFDIADNALGITASVKSQFDNRKVVNRALDGTTEHRLLKGRVDPEEDRIGRGSIYLMGAKHVAEVIRTVNVGLDGRVSRKQEAAWHESELIAKTQTFLDLLTESFPSLEAVTVGQIMPDGLRRTSLLGSVLFVRVLAGAYYELTNDHAWTGEQVGAFFTKLAPHVTAPVYPESIWMKELDGNIFSDGGLAPHGRRQDLKGLKDALVTWALDMPKFITAKPAPRPKPEEPYSDPELGIGYTKFGADIPATV